METLRSYINGMTPDEQRAFADRAKTSIGFLRKAISVNQQLGEGLCIRLVRASDGALSPEDLRDDVDWDAVRENPKAA